MHESRDLSKPVELIIFSVYPNLPRSAIAWYEKTTQKIHCLRLEEPENPLLKYTEILAYLNNLEPHSIILPKTGCEDFLIKVKEVIGLSSSQEDQINLPLIFLKKSEYQETGFQNSLLQLDFSDILEEITYSSKEMPEKKISSEDLFHRKMFFLRTHFQIVHFPEIFLSLGALIVILLQSGEITTHYKISNISLQDQELLMFISKKSLESLQIFKEEIHPSLIKGKGRSKEGFSLYNVYEAFITTTSGRRFLKKRMKSPIYDKSKLIHRLEILKVLLGNFTDEDFKTIKKNLAKICDFGALLIKFRDFRSKFEDWKKLKQGLEGLFHLVSFLKSHPNLMKLETDLKVIHDLLHLIPFEALDALRNIINKCLNLTTEGTIRSQITINHGINEELDNLKRVFYQLDEFLELYAQDELNKLRSLSQNNPSAKSISSIGFSFFPQVGYMILIPKSDISIDSKYSKGETSERTYPSTKFSETFTSNTRINQEENEKDCDENNLDFNENFEENENGTVDERDIQLKHETINHLRENLPHRKMFHDIFGFSEDWDFHFELEGFLYFKNAFTNDLDSAYGDIYEHSIAIEHEILRTLEEEVLRNNESLLYLNDLIAEIDCFIAFALMAREYNLKSPEYTDEPILLLHKGRHLLLEILLRQSFIANDYIVYNYKDAYDNNFEASQQSLINKNYSNRVSILTGPNFSGKSVFLKQIGLIVYMAQIGSFVPAEYCKLGLFDKILTNIHLNDSLSSGANGLEEEIQTIFENLRQASNRSLLLIDEFGRNSSHEDNLSLFNALIKYISTGVFPSNKFLQPKIRENEEKKTSILENHFEKMKEQYNKVPISIVTTHLKDLELIQENYLVRYLEMQVVFLNKEQKPIDLEILLDPNDTNNYDNRLKQWKSLDLTSKLVYLYKLKPGFALNSFAIFLANELLNEEWIIKRAFQIQICLLQLEKIPNIPDIDQKFFEKTKTIIEKVNN